MENVNGRMVNPLIISKNKTNSKARKEAQGAVDFKQDNQLTAAEKKILQKEFGMNADKLKFWAEQKGGVEFLDKLTHAGDGLSDKKEIQAKRKEVVMEYFLNNKTETPNKFIREQLKKFGVKDAEINARIADNQIQQQKAEAAEAKLNSERPITRLFTGSPQAGDAAQKDVRMQKVLDKDGNLQEVKLYTKNSTLEDDPFATLTPTKDGLLEINGRYFKLDNNGLSQVDAPKPKFVEAAPKEPEKVEAPKAEFNDVFNKVGKKVNIDETGSTQRYTRNSNWETSVVIPKRANYDGNGVPKEIAIQLPSDYGQKNADGVAQKRYSTLKLIDEENNVYSDKAGLRTFQMNITDDGITLKQVAYNNGEISDLTAADSKKVKDFLDKNTKLVEEAAAEKGQGKAGHSIGSDKNLSHEQTKIEIKTKEDADKVLAQLSNRNTAWGTYTAIGSDNGQWTGNLGLIETLMDEKFPDANGQKHSLTFDDLKPALKGLMERVPEKFNDDADYKTARALIDTAEKGGKLKSRDLDKALINLAKKMNIQGTNFMANEYLRSANGKVQITPDWSDSMWNTDAKFELPNESGSTKPYYFYRDDTLYDKCYDFQDIVGEGGLISNNSLGNNRLGEINFNADKLDSGERYYFQTSGGRELTVTVENGVGYVQNANGDKIKINDILNGRVPMPD